MKRKHTVAIQKLTAHAALLLALLAGTGCGSNGEIGRVSAEMQLRHAARQRAMAEYQRIGSLIEARIARNPLAAGALALVADAAQRDTNDNAAGAEIILGGGYCLFNAAECTSLAADITELQAARSRAAEESKILATEINALSTRLNQLR